MKEQTMTQEQGNVYFKELVEKFNKDHNDPTLTPTEQFLLTRIVEVGKAIAELEEKIKTLNEEANEKMAQVNELSKQAINLQGRSQGYTDSLLALKQTD
jgi:FtsZ-binding cell division protein ZapB